jgi:hypothetical protein
MATTVVNPPAAAARVPVAMTITSSVDELTVGQVLQAKFDIEGTITPGTMGIVVEVVKGKG